MTLQRILVELFGLEPPGVDMLRLEDTALCVDCETLSPARGEACIACGGRALLNLKRVLGGIRPEESARLVERGDWRSCFATTTLQLADQSCHTPSRIRCTLQEEPQGAGEGPGSCRAVHEAA